MTIDWKSRCEWKLFGTTTLGGIEQTKALGAVAPVRSHSTASDQSPPNRYIMNGTVNLPQTQLIIYVPRTATVQQGHRNAA